MLALEIMELRAFASAKALLDRPGLKQDDIPNSPMIDRVMAIKAELMRRRAEERFGRK